MQIDPNDYEMLYLSCNCRAFSDLSIETKRLASTIPCNAPAYRWYELLAIRMHSFFACHHA